jgi:hypothetical protein
MAKTKEEQIFVQIGEERLELIGADKEAFLNDRTAAQAEHEIQLKAQAELNKLKISAYTKLGLTEQEIKAIL